MQPLHAMLVGGGDSRLLIDAGSGANPYGCTPRPGGQSASWSSCTASTISPPAYAEVEREYARMASGCVPGPGDREEVLRGRLAAALGIAGLGASVVLAPSGTDAVLHALFLARSLAAGPIQSVLLAADETGSGVPLAAAGRHPDPITAGGLAVDRGMPIPGLGEGLALAAIPVRDADGVARPAQAIDDQAEEEVTRALAAGRQVLLIAMDCSKIGACYPSPACLDRIDSRSAGRQLILVDACQGRIGADRLAAHLQRGRMVMLTGSKFYGGPSFSAALLVPDAIALRCSTLGPLPSGWRGYASAHAWPRGWMGIRSAMADHGNDGLYLRWIAALCEMEAYAAVPAAYRRDHLLACATSVVQALARSAEVSPLEMLPAPACAGSDAFPPTIFPFFVRRQGGRVPFDACLGIYRALCAQGIAIGQPVRVGQAGALRLCTDARLVIRQWSSGRSADDTGAVSADLSAMVAAIARS